MRFLSVGFDEAPATLFWQFRGGFSGGRDGVEGVFVEAEETPEPFGGFPHIRYVILGTGLDLALCVYERILEREREGIV